MQGWHLWHVNMTYFCTNFVIIMQLSYVRQGWCFPTYLPKFFQRSCQRKFRECAFFLRKRSLPKIFL